MTKNIELLNKLPTGYDCMYPNLNGRHPAHVSQSVLLEMVQNQKQQDLSSGCFANEEEWQFMYNKVTSAITKIIADRPKITNRDGTLFHAIPKSSIEKITNVLQNKHNYLKSEFVEKTIEVKEPVKEIKVPEVKQTMEIKAVELKETDKLHALIEKNQEAETIEIKNLYELIARNEDIRNKSSQDLEQAVIKNIDLKIAGITTQFQNFSEAGKLEIKKLNDTLADMTQRTASLEKYNEVLENRLVKVEGYEGRIAVIESTISSFYDMYVSIRDVLTCNSCTLDDYMLIGNNAVLYVDNHEIVS